MKKGDHVYYIDREGAHIPAVVEKVFSDFITIKGDFSEGKKIKTVKISNCILQSEWLEEQ